MTYPIPDSADYAYVKWMLVSKIDRDRGSGRPRDILSDHDERTLATHDTATERRGDPCDSCGEPWPCPTVASILAPE